MPFPPFLSLGPSLWRVVVLPSPNPLCSCFPTCDASSQTWRWLRRSWPILPHQRDCDTCEQEQDQQLQCLASSGHPNRPEQSENKHCHTLNKEQSVNYKNKENNNNKTYGFLSHSHTLVVMGSPHRWHINLPSRSICTAPAICAGLARGAFTSTRMTRPTPGGGACATTTRPAGAVEVWGTGAGAGVERDGFDWGTKRKEEKEKKKKKKRKKKRTW